MDDKAKEATQNELSDRQLKTEAAAAESGANQETTPPTRKPYEKPRLKKYDQIDHVAIYGVE